MKIGTVSILAAALATSVSVSSAFAQGTPIAGSFGGSRTQRTVTPVPSSPILPMTNPIAPMGNPIQPVIPSPFMRYGGTTPTVVIPQQSRGGRGYNASGGNNQGQRGGRDVVYVPVAVPTYYYPPSYYYQPEYEPSPVTIPGQLPGGRYDYSRATSFNPSPNAPPATPPASTFVYEPQPELYFEPRMIINEPRPNRVLEPPAIGTSRADVVGRLGQPWGTVTARGTETLYFDGGLVVVIAADGRVIQVR